MLTLQILTFAPIATSCGLALHKRFKSASVSTYSAAIIDSFKDDVIAFALAVRQHLRDDYKEFLELVIIFLGGKPPHGVHFQ